jgi:hypothetical protein
MMFKVTIKYEQLESIEEITGTLVPADGPFNGMWVIDTGEEHVCIPRYRVVSVHCVVPEAFLVTQERIEKSREMDMMFFQEEYEKTQNPTDVSEVYYS